MKGEKTAFDSFLEWIKAKMYIGVGKSLLLWFLAISFIPLLTLSVVNYMYAYLGLTVVAEKSLITTSQLRVEYLNTFFRETTSFLETQSKLPMNIRFFEELNKRQQNYAGAEAFIRSSEWKEISAEQDKFFAPFMQQQGYYDIYFIDQKGNILYSYREEKDLGSNILKGVYAESLYARTARKALEENRLLFSDIEIYEPSYDLLSGFLIKPIKTGSEVTGLMALQITTERINNIIQDDVGFGESGEAFLIGADLMMRSASRFIDETAILAKQVSTVKTQEWQREIRNSNQEANSQQLVSEEEISSYANLNGSYVLGIYRNLDYVEDIGVNWALVEEIENNEAFAYAQQLSNIAKVSFIITFILVFFIAMWVTRKFVRPIKKLSAWAKQVAIGELISKKVRAPKNEVGEMVDTFNKLVSSLQSYAQVSSAAAYGDYTRSVMIRSEKDVMGKSMNQMVESFKKVVEQANRIAKGDYSTQVAPRSDKDTLGLALYEMTRQLRSNAKQMQEQDWLKTGINQLENKLNGLKNIEKLTSEVLSFLVSYLNAEIGLFYIQKDNLLELTASYAFSTDDKELLQIKIGHGLVGQVAKEKQKIIFRQKQADLPRLNYGAGIKTPSCFVVAPVIFEENVLGVIQIGASAEMDDLKHHFLESSLENIAIAINMVQAHERVEKLLSQTQQQAQTLQHQQKELQQSNEELEEQASALKLSEENLKNQQEELRVTNEELEERTKDLEVERDTIRLKNEALKTAQKEIKAKATDLEKASTYKSEFLSNMSHELRTPLNSILILSQLLQENKNSLLTDKEVKFAKTIHSSGKDLLNLINEILDLSKVEAGKMEVYAEDLSLKSIISFIRDNFKPQLDKKGLYLKFDVAKDVPGQIISDSQKVLQIIRNLISNAIKFTSSGGIIFRVEKVNQKSQLSSVIPLPDMLAFSVEDTGTGIPADKQEQIFEAFRQADGTTNRKFGGTGLGLTISRKLAGLLGGEIRVKSEEGKGSVFTLHLPLEPKDDLTNIPDISDREMPDEVNVQKNIAEAEIPDDRENITNREKPVLIIEDDVNFSSLLMELARSKGFKCIAAFSGEKGLSDAEIYHPGAIILDLGLPDISGYEVIKRLKENSRTRHIPVHIISAEDKSMKALKMGAVGFLTKPVSREKLDEVFKEIETLTSKPLRKALVVEDENIMRRSIVNLLNDGNVEVTAVDTGEKAYALLQKEKFECMILDLGLKELSGFELLEEIKKDQLINNLPVIVYTGKELSREEDEKLRNYADSIIIKGARSFERLLSEANLFLHRVQEVMPESKQKFIAEIGSQEDILTGKTILLVDDDMRNVFALSSVLQEHGLNVIVGKNGKQALQKLSKHQEIDLVLMDIMMPEMDGYEAMTAIRRNKKLSSLPIIALTAKAMKEDRQKCLEAGANDYIAKPVSTVNLVSLLKVWLYQKR